MALFTFSPDDEHFFLSSVLPHFPFASVNSWQEVKLGAEESRALRTQVQLAEAAQKQARGMEMDYEEVIHLLEAEIAELKTQRVEQPVPTNKVTQSDTPCGPTKADFVQALSFLKVHTLHQFAWMHDDTTGKVSGFTLYDCCFQDFFPALAASRGK